MACFSHVLSNYPGSFRSAELLRIQGVRQIYPQSISETGGIQTKKTGLRIQTLGMNWDIGNTVSQLVVDMDWWVKIQSVEFFLTPREHVLSSFMQHRLWLHQSGVCGIVLESGKICILSKLHHVLWFVFTICLFQSDFYFKIAGKMLSVFSGIMNREGCNKELGSYRNLVAIGCSVWIWILRKERSKDPGLSSSNSPKIGRWLGCNICFHSVELSIDRGER